MIAEGVYGARVDVPYLGMQAGDRLLIEEGRARIVRDVPLEIARAVVAAGYLEPLEKPVQRPLHVIKGGAQ